jgi:hypothetical protein
MRVSYFLSSLPLWQLILLVVVIPTAVAMAAQVLIRKWAGVDKLARNNEIAGFKFATVGVIYAVLLAFVVIAVWEKFSDAQNAVTEEAGAIAALHHFTEGKEPETVAMQAALSKYLTAAIALNRSGSMGTASMAEIFRLVDEVTAARRVRLHLATGLVPNVIWIALFMGALLTVGFTLFFGSENPVAQVSMTGVLSVLVTTGLVVILSIDHPFTGPVYIHPDPLASVLAEIVKPPG